MPSEISEIKKMKVFQKGQVVIPVSLRKKYDIDIGDHVEVIPSKNGILLKPSPSKKGRGSLTDILFGSFGEYAQKKKPAGKKDIHNATQTGFLEGWQE